MRTIKKMLTVLLSLAMIIGFVPGYRTLAAELSAEIQDLDLGESIEGYNSFSKVLRMNKTGSVNMRLSWTTVELTSGDKDKFSVMNRDGGNMSGTGTWDLAYVSPKTGLSVGNYSATITLYYDNDGPDGPENKVALDTATVSFKVKEASTKYGITIVDGFADRSEACKGEIVAITAGTAPAGKVFSHWEVTTGEVSIDVETSSYATFVMPDGAVSIKAVFVDKVLKAEVDDADMGEVFEGYTYTDYFKTVYMTRIGSEPMSLTYTTVELTSGDKDKFMVTNLDGGMMSQQGSYSVAYIYPVSGLSAGTYSATITLYYDRDGASGIEAPIALDTATVTIKVSTSITSYNVTINNGSADKTTANPGETIHISSDAAPAGKIFSKWVATSDNVDFANPLLSDTSFEMPEEDVTITALYEDYTAPISYEISFDSNGGEGSKSSENVVENFGYILPSENTFKAPDGKEFDCWEVIDKATLTGKKMQPNEEVNVVKDLIIKAIWKNKTCKVTFNANGYGAAPASQVVDIGNKATRPSDPIVSGYVFGGWYQDKACKTVYDFNTAVTSDITVYAKWTAVTTPAPTDAPTTVPTTAPTPAPTDKPTTVPTSVPTSPDSGFGGFVERLYEVALGRPSEPEGKAYWCEHVGNGDLTGAACAREFLTSPEFHGRGLSDEEFLKVLYKAFFDRDAAGDPEGFNFWLNSLKTQGRDRVVEGFIDSNEWCNICAKYGVKSGAATAKATVASSNATAFAERLYTKCLGRDAEADGLKWWSLALTNHEVSGSTAARGFFESKEFVGFGTSNKEYLTRLYRTFMGREPDDDGMNYWLGCMNNGMGRGEVFDRFVDSQEFTEICKSYGIDR